MSPEQTEVPDLWKQSKPVSVGGQIGARQLAVSAGCSLGQTNGQVPNRSTDKNLCVTQKTCRASQAASRRQD
jgi:hypothetical protein